MMSGLGRDKSEQFTAVLEKARAKLADAISGDPARTKRKVQKNHKKMTAQEKKEARDAQFGLRAMSHSFEELAVDSAPPANFE